MYFPRRFTTSFATLSLGCALAAAAEMPASSQHNAVFADAAVMNALHGDAWAVLVFAPQGKQSAVSSQLAEFDQHNMLLADNNMVVVLVPPAATATDPATAADATPAPKLESVAYVTNAESVPVEAVDAQSRARSQYHVADDEFAVVLVDNQGVERGRWSAPTCALEIQKAVKPEPTAFSTSDVSKRHWYQLSNYMHRNR